MKHKTHADIVKLWGVPERLSEALGLKPFSARFWYHRDSIPDGYWLDIISAGKRRKPRINLTLRMFAIAAREKRRREAETASVKAA